MRSAFRRLARRSTPAWRRFRQLRIEDSRRGLERVYAEAGPDYRRLMRYAGLDPEHGLLRRGNYNRTLILPSTVFEADDTGRSYRLRPRTRSIWFRNNLALGSGVLMYFLVPDTPGLGDAIHGTSAIPVETSRQTTNSWGLRGPEPDLEAPLPAWFSAIPSCKACSSATRRRPPSA